MHIWQAQEAKAKFSKLLDECQKEPQLVTRNGEAAAYMVSAVQFDKILHNKEKQKKMSVGEFLKKSPLFRSGIPLGSRPRTTGSHRDIYFRE